MLNRRQFIAVSAAGAAAALFEGTAAFSQSRKAVVMGKTIDDITTGFDPAEAYDFTGWEVCGNLYRTLLTIDPADSTKLVGDIADSWEVSEDGLTFVFKIKQDIVFDSGATLTAEDAAFSLHRVVTLNKGPGFVLTQFGWNAENVAEMIKATEKFVLTVRLPKVHATGLVLYCLTSVTAAVVDKAAAMANESGGDAGNAWLRFNSAGSGSYKLAKYEASNIIVLQAREKANPEPKIDRVIIRHVADPATQLLQVQKGDLQVARNLGADQLAAIKEDANLATSSGLTTNLLHVTMNTKLPFFAKPEVRQAIKWAIDYQAIAHNITPGIWSVHQSFIAEGLPGAVTKTPFTRDVEKAKALMKAAGYEDGFKVTMDYYAVWPVAEIAQALQANLADIGITVELLAGETKQVISKTRARNSEMYFGVTYSDYPDAFSMAQWLCSNPDDSDDSAMKTSAWRNHFKDDELNAMTDAIEKETDSAKRLEILDRMQDIYAERGNAVILLQQKEVAVTRSDIKGLKPGLLQYYTNYASIDLA